MSSSRLPNDVRTFVRMYIDSVELLEVLLTIRTDPEKPWSISEVARTLTVTVESARLRLDQLEERRLAQRDDDGAYTYTAKSLGIEDTVAQLAESYAKRRTRVISLIFSGPTEGVRGFADAFKLRED